MTAAPAQPATTAAAQASAVTLAAAGASFAAALVHGSVIAVHFAEYWLFGLFFLLVTPLQVLWSGLAVRGPAASRRLLLTGALGNAVVIAIWAVSRLVGLPFGPHAFTPEAVTLKDLLCTYDEAAVVMLCVLLLRGRTAPSWLLAGVWVVACLSFLAALLPGGH